MRLNIRAYLFYNDSIYKTHHIQGIWSGTDLLDETCMVLTANVAY